MTAPTEPQTTPPVLETRVLPTAVPAPVAPVGTVMTPEQITQMQEQAAERARTAFQSELDQRDSQLAALTADLTARQEAERAAQQQASAAAEAARVADQSALERVAELQQQMQRQQEQMNAELSRRDAILAQERRLSDLTALRTRLISEAGDTIMPHLTPYVAGNSEEEIRASIENAKATTSNILAEVQEAVGFQQQAQATAIRATPTASVTAPANGPIEQYGQTKQWSNEELLALSPQEYAQHRDQLLPLAGGNPNGGRGTGMYGN